MGIIGDIARGTVQASEAEIIDAAKSLPKNASDEQREAARQSVKQRAKKPAKKSRPKGKQGKASAKPSTQSDDVASEIRTAAMKSWQRLKDRFAIDEHPALRKVMAEIIREEQK